MYAIFVKTGADEYLCAVLSTIDGSVGGPTLNGGNLDAHAANLASMAWGYGTHVCPDKAHFDDMYERMRGVGGMLKEER